MVGGCHCGKPGRLRYYVLLSFFWSSSHAQTVLEVIRSTPNLSTFSAVVNATSLVDQLNSRNETLTVFAPSNSALRTAFATSAFTCTSDFYSTSGCTSLQQLMSATDVTRIVSNVVARLSVDYATLSNGMRIQFLGDAVAAVYFANDGTRYLGNAPIIAGEFQASNGAVLILSSFPPGDISLNSTAIFASSLVGDYGPFSFNQRVSMSQIGSGSSTADLGTLQSGYQRTRKLVDLPQGGLTYPMSISYDPSSMYRLMRSAPTAYRDSEASPGPAVSSSLSPASPYSTLAQAPVATLRRSTAPAPAAISSVQIQTFASPRPQGVGEMGVLAESLPASIQWKYAVLNNVTRPPSNDTLAYMSVLELGSLYQQGLVTSVELVQIFTARMKRFDYVLEAVITYTTELAMEQAQAADKLFSGGTYLGPLHGIPYGLKDIMAVKGYPTTWGAPQFRNQYINADCNVYKRLTAAGAVLIAKLVTGEMAYDDVWFGGRTKNPWNIMEGSSGSSAGPTASVVAGTVPFSVGSETEGSLMSPSSVCGSTSMRPSLGSIGRSWTMTLADSLDKLGPICRTAQDCAIIFDILRGKEDLDPSSRDATLIDPFSVNISRMTVGYSPSLQGSATEVMSVLKAKGVTLKPYSLNFTVSSEDLIKVIMISETAAHFDYWQRSRSDAQNRQQDYWPPLLRNARTIPAVEYIQAQRARGILATQILSSMKAAGIDAFIANTTTELAACNLVGIPTVSVPIGFPPVSAVRTDLRRNPSTIGFFGWPNGEPEILALAMAWQNETLYHQQQPPIDNVPAAVLSQCLPFSRCTLPGNGTAPGPAPIIGIGAAAADVG